MWRAYDVARSPRPLVRALPRLYVHDHDPGTGKRRSPAGSGAPTPRYDTHCGCCAFTRTLRARHRDRLATPTAATIDGSIVAGTRIGRSGIARRRAHRRHRTHPPPYVSTHPFLYLPIAASSSSTRRRAPCSRRARLDVPIATASRPTCSTPSSTAGPHRGRARRPRVMQTWGVAALGAGVVRAQPRCRAARSPGPAGAELARACSWCPKWRNRVHVPAGAVELDQPHSGRRRASRWRSWAIRAWASRSADPLRADPGIDWSSRSARRLEPRTRCR